MSDTDERQEQLDDLADTIEELQSNVAFSDHKGSIAELDTDIPELRDRVQRLRERGYLYKSYLENKVETLAQKWEAAKPKVQRELRQAEAAAEPVVEEVSRKLTLTQRTRRERDIQALETQVNQAENKLEELDSAIDAHYAEVRSAYHQTANQVRQVEWTLDELDEATFELLAGERPLEAVKAQWYRDGKKKGPEGVLYLTDQRIIFEQKEKVATKKVLFIATEKEMVQEMLMAEAITTIEKVVPASTGLIKTHTLEFDFGAGANTGHTTFQVKGDDPKMWAALIKRITNGQIQSERVFLEGEEASADAFEDALANAPEECSSCGAPVPAITQGQRQVQCEYCGNVMKW
jgi:hypothetical protein